MSFLNLFESANISSTTAVQNYSFFSSSFPFACSSLSCFFSFSSNFSINSTLPQLFPFSNSASSLSSTSFISSTHPLSSSSSTHPLSSSSSTHPLSSSSSTHLLSSPSSRKSLAFSNYRLPSASSFDLPFSDTSSVINFDPPLTLSAFSLPCSSSSSSFLPSSSYSSFSLSSPFSRAPEGRITNVWAYIQIKKEDFSYDEMFQICRSMRYAEYDPRKFKATCAPVVVMLTNPVCRCLIYKNGKLQIMGSVTETDALRQAKRIISFLRYRCFKLNEKGEARRTEEEQQEEEEEVGSREEVEEEEVGSREEVEEEEVGSREEQEAESKNREENKREKKAKEKEWMWTEEEQNLDEEECNLLQDELFNCVEKESENFETMENNFKVYRKEENRRGSEKKKKRRKGEEDELNMYYNYLEKNELDSRMSGQSEFSQNGENGILARKRNHGGNYLEKRKKKNGEVCELREDIKYIPQLFTVIQLCVTVNLYMQLNMHELLESETLKSLCHLQRTGEMYIKIPSYIFDDCDSETQTTKSRKHNFHAAYSDNSFDDTFRSVLDANEDKNTMFHPNRCRIALLYYTGTLRIFGCSSRQEVNKTVQFLWPYIYACRNDELSQLEFIVKRKKLAKRNT